VTESLAAFGWLKVLIVVDVPGDQPFTGFVQSIAIRLPLSSAINCKFCLPALRLHVSRVASAAGPRSLLKNVHEPPNWKIASRQNARRTDCMTSVRV
jgi:hypothetical protein